MTLYLYPAVLRTAEKCSCVCAMISIKATPLWGWSISRALIYSDKAFVLDVSNALFLSNKAIIAMGVINLWQGKPITIAV